MTVESDLMRLLSAGVRPGGPARGPSPNSASAPSVDDGVDFRALLDQARQGAIKTGIPVSVARGVEVKFTDDQLDRLSQAADQAEAAGANRALVLMDGLAIKLDVGVRQVTGLADAQSGKPIAGIDAVIQVPPKNGATPGSSSASSVLAPPATLTSNMNASLLRALGSTRVSTTEPPS